MTTRRRRVGSESEQIVNPADRNSTSNSFISENENSLNSKGLYSVPEPPKRGMARDRTVEFASAIRSLQGRTIARAVALQDPIRARNLQSYGEFMLIAKTVGKNIASTYAKLEKLTILAKRKPLFNDQPTEIQELTYIIKEDLNSLNGQIAKLQDVMRSQAVSSKIKTKNNHLMSHSSSIVLALQSKLASMSSQFKSVLEVRTENMKEAKRRRDQFSQSGPGSAASGETTPLLLMSSQDDHVTIDLSGSAPGTLPIQRQSQLQVYDETEQYLTSRAETMQSIESTIVELGGIFQQLAHMVKEQEEMVDRIDSNVQDSEMSVEAAHTEILKYFQSVTSNRWLMIKIFGVLIFFFMFFLIFLT